MAITCDRSTFVTTGKCFTSPQFDRREQLAIAVYRLAQHVDAIVGSPVYSVAPFDALWGATNEATCGMGHDQLWRPFHACCFILMTSLTRCGFTSSACFSHC